MPQKQSATANTSSPSLLSLVPRSVVLARLSMTAANGATATKLDNKMLLLQSICRYLKTSGFSKTVKKLKSEAKLDEDEITDALLLDLDEICSKHLEARSHAIKAPGKSDKDLKSNGNAENCNEEDSSIEKASKKKKKAKNDAGKDESGLMKPDVEPTTAVIPEPEGKLKSIKIFLALSKLLLQRRRETPPRRRRRSERPKPNPSPIPSQRTSSVFHRVLVSTSSSAPSNPPRPPPPRQPCNRRLHHQPPRHPPDLRRLPHRQIHLPQPPSPDRRARVSMDSAFLEELQEKFDTKKVSLSRVLVGERYLGGAEEVRQLHECGELKSLQCLFHFFINQAAILVELRWWLKSA
uniref:LisH domain-containing protein n=1 Tax=Kalanchoe fedtschenkoi TaxID=63787 RepID=A0A7N0VNL7_KALFE